MRKRIFASSDQGAADASLTNSALISVDHSVVSAADQANIHLSSWRFVPKTAGALGIDGAAAMWEIAREGPETVKPHLHQAVRFSAAVLPARIFRLLASACVGKPGFHHLTNPHVLLADRFIQTWFSAGCGRCRAGFCIGPETGCRS